MSHTQPSFRKPGNTLRETRRHSLPERTPRIFSSFVELTISVIRIGLPKQHRLVKLVAGYVVFGYILTQILFLGVWCRPIQQYWQVPVDNSKQSISLPNGRAKPLISPFRRPMRLLLPPLSNRLGLQHLLRPNDAPDPPPPPHQSSPPMETQNRPLRRLLPRHLRHPRRNPKPLLQLHRRLRLPHLPKLVRRRSRHRGHGHQYPALLAAPLAGIPSRLLQNLPRSLILDEQPLLLRRRQAHNHELCPQPPAKPPG